MPAAMQPAILFFKFKSRYSGSSEAHPRHHQWHKLIGRCIVNCEKQRLQFANPHLTRSMRQFGGGSINMRILLGMICGLQHGGTIEVSRIFRVELQATRLRSSRWCEVGRPANLVTHANAACGEALAPGATV
jgi:hypothetical protein